MTTALKLRRGTTAQHSSFTGAEGEVTVDTTKDTVVVHDGSTIGGFPLARESDVALKLNAANPSYTGTLTGSAGTVSAPAITTTGDTNTGIFFPAADTIAFTEGGVESMRVNSAGNVGIGTAEPTVYAVNDKVLQVSSGANGGAIRISNTTTGANGGLLNYQLGLNSYLYNTSAGFLAFGASNAEAMRITSAGNLLVGSSASTDLVLSQIQSGSTSNTSAGLQILTSTVGTGGLYYGDSTTGTARFQGFIEYSNGSDSMTFGTNTAERMRIDASGNLLVGVSSVQSGTPSDSAGVSIYGNGSGAPGASVFVRNSTNSVMIVNNKNSGGGLLIFHNGGNTVGSITSNGTTTVYNTTSDYRLKKVIASVTDSGTRLDALQPIEYDWNTGGRTRGFLAHQFAEVYPSSVSGEKDAVDKDGKPVYQAMQAATSEVMADLIAEIQSLRKRVAQLESK